MVDNGWLLRGVVGSVRLLGALLEAVAGTWLRDHYRGGLGLGLGLTLGFCALVLSLPGGRRLTRCQGDLVRDGLRLLPSIG